MTHLSLPPFRIRRRAGAIVVSFLAAPLFLVTPARSQSAAPRDLIQSGVDAYIQAGAGSAFSAWSKGGAIEGSTQEKLKFDSLKQIDALYGKMEGFDVILDLSISPRVRMVYIVLYYAKGTAYGYFETYRLKSGAWVMASMSINTAPSEVIPAALLTRFSSAP